MREMDEQQIYHMIRETLQNFYGAARLSVIRKWRKMTLAQRRCAVRSLVLMWDVSLDPAKYFSRKTTVNSWRDQHKMISGVDFGEPGYQTYSIVCSPADVVVGYAGAAFESKLELQHYYGCFCNAVLDWEYDRTSVNVRHQAQAFMHIEKVDDIMQQSKQWPMRLKKQRSK